VPVTSDHVSVFVVEGKIVLVKRPLALVPPWIFDGRYLRLGVVVGPQQDRRVEWLGRGNGHGQSLLLGIDMDCLEDCSRDIPADVVVPASEARTMDVD
jgi:hypothetical protein